MIGIAVLLALAAPVREDIWEAYDCEPVVDSDSRGSVKITFRQPYPEVASRDLPLKDLMIDDPSEVISFFPTKTAKGWLTRTGVIEIVPREVQRSAWLRIVPDFETFTAEIRGSFVSYGHPIISSELIGKCTFTLLSSQPQKK